VRVCCIYIDVSAEVDNQKLRQANSARVGRAYHLGLHINHDIWRNLGIHVTISSHHFVAIGKTVLKT
jgi:hypothetical protein